MKNRIARLPLLLLALLIVASSAQAQTSIATIDLKKVFNGYWKRMQADTILQTKGKALDAQLQTMTAEYRGLADGLKKLDEALKEPLISAVEKEKRTKTLQGQALKVKELEATINDFQRAARAQLDELRHQSRENILKEIQDFVRKKAKDKKVSLVLDTASETINQTPVILYNDDSNDWTQEILTSLNITAPPGVLKDSKPLDPK
jgi:outer membrane protein